MQPGRSRLGGSKTTPDYPLHAAYRQQQFQQVAPNFGASLQCETNAVVVQELPDQWTRQRTITHRAVCGNSKPS